MAMITCPECGRSVSDKASTCPGCGCPIAQASNDAANNARELDDLYTLAHRARDSENIEDDAKYYGQIVQLYPNDPEAYFFSVYYQQLNSQIYKIPDAAYNIRSSIDPTIDLIVALPSDKQEQLFSMLAKYTQSAVEMLYYNADQKLTYVAHTQVRGIDPTSKKACFDLIEHCASALKNTARGKMSAFKVYEYILNAPKFKDMINEDDIWRSMHECDPSFDADSRINAKVSQQQTAKKIENKMSWGLLVLIILIIAVPLILAIFVF